VWGQQQTVGKGEKGVAMEMCQSTGRRLKEGKPAILPTPKHRETACHIHHLTKHFCQFEGATFLGENVGLNVDLFI